MDRIDIGKTTDVKSIAPESPAAQAAMLLGKERAVTGIGGATTKDKQRVVVLKLDDGSRVPLWPQTVALINSAMRGASSETLPENSR